MVINLSKHHVIRNPLIQGGTRMRKTFFLFHTAGDPLKPDFGLSGVVSGRNLPLCLGV
jgi:hypothetical protein